MRDEALVASGTTKAEKAVSYILKRIAHDADLRYLMIGSQAYGLLCEAEKERTGIEVGGKLGIDPPPGTVPARARLACYEDLVEALEAAHSILIQFTDYQKGEWCEKIKAVLAKAKSTR